ncbi:MAG: hypothetical protein IKF90_06530, partial [Parasporobacterium sp.]|nr:hypothetical protein [Parasporobacterium sp.]
MKKRLFSIVLAAVTCLAVIASVLNLGAVESGAAQMSQTESKRPETLSGANTAESDALSRANAALIEAA